MITFSNARTNATFNDWPLGGNKRGTCTFTVEIDPKRGHRIARQTSGKPKRGTYSHRACIVDGSNGRTYLLSDTGPSYGGFISIRRSDFMDAGSDDIGGNAAVWPGDERYTALVALMNAAHP